MKIIQILESAFTGMPAFVSFLFVTSFAVMFTIVPDSPPEPRKPPLLNHLNPKVKTEIERNHQATMSLELEHYASAGAIRKTFSECIKAENELRKQLKDDGFLDPMENEDLSSLTE